MTARMVARRAGHVTAVWLSFVVAHVVVAWLGWVLPNQPMGDVVLVYLPWSSAVLDGTAVVGITEPWVYPQLAMVPMLMAQAPAAALSGILGMDAAYLVGWAIVVTVADFLAFGLLVGRGHSRTRLLAGGFWTLALVLLGPVGMYRVDAFVVPVAIVGVLLLRRRPAVAAVVLTLGAWIKIWPGAIVLAAAVALRTRMLMVGVAAITTGGILLVLLLGAGPHALGFLSAQTGRGLQIEAVAATPFLWMAATGAAIIQYDVNILTFQVTAPGAARVADLLTPIMIVAVSGIVAIAVWRTRNGAAWRDLLPPFTLALVVALIVTNKVGSPQFQTWLIAPVVLWILLDRARAGVAGILVLCLSAMTFAVYPLMYGGLLRAEGLPIVVLSLRNVLLVALLVYCVRGILRVPVTSRSPIRSH